ncbi:MAG: bifunctional 4-hydroxy-2-oxoglutarate aldolase/2-dehydro-3-deoxy-phosphogluconate aldolase [Bacteroidetes bacterium]|nr:bifunctional 4-hydroxy-2-oxoglutarate aldolase/2-dehydro-3-deoxy-phosphogluconate aldolase [Bacteroidota bacterium]MBU1483742.1 bifunctional 4-hydroxy-2-oxoglutarate aldolase/2-dehydro-3-deoxy-phosphogluconate aldolase [Bacteroidota bacterium]MBU2046276.1 bifunctional 4-hydroxy-2-oxoglutarate aldolase/2-dehydro-3-deoxy-phosphogluconate aldolase [Bacteroidota bacterium]MBU2268085.1 bifunctional 4-hydroxy-2-oxoglutarate aldolase/2-dehydro-3-deoxy-phosphogluconate aldolase [Bacteroidota bacteriu
MDNKSSILKAITNQGMLPLFFHPDEEKSIKITQTVYDAGVRVIEYTNRGKEALANFKKLKEAALKTMPDLKLGIGTIKNSQQAKDFIAAGADFIVCPIVLAEVANACEEAKMLWVPGCMTPTEIALAQSLRAGLIKIFPANILGQEFIASIKDLFAGQLFMPTGGVDLSKENIESWFKAGVCAVGMGSKLISKDVMESGNYEKLAKNTKEVLALIQSIK